MSLDEEKRNTLVELELEKAVNTYEDASLLAERERWSGAANRLYYAVFHAVNALLIKDGHLIKSHKGAFAEFSRNYVLTEQVSSEYGKLFRQLETMREESDYDCMFHVEADQIKEKLQPAKEMIDMIASRVK